MAELNWRHHTLIQSLMSGGPLKESNFHSPSLLASPEKIQLFFSMHYSSSSFDFVIDFSSITKKSEPNPSCHQKILDVSEREGSQGSYPGSMALFAGDGSIGIGIRSFIYLRSWFRNKEVPPCSICNKAGVKVETACAGCGAEWQCPEVSPDAEEGENVSRVSHPTPSKIKKIKRCPDEMGSRETSQVSHPIHRKLRRSERLQ
ncbi:hypothetical protein ACLOJK_005341 [Asimina triloba]